MCGYVMMGEGLDGRVMKRSSGLMGFVGRWVWFTIPLVCSWLYSLVCGRVA